jgi:hypothetical protein
MFKACDVVGPGRAPVRNHNSYAAVYFIGFLFIVCFFIQVRAPPRTFLALVYGA